MGQIDKQKEKISFLRSLFFFLLASLFGIVAFIFTKYESLSTFKLIMADLVGIILFVAIVAIGEKLRLEIDKLEDM